MALETAIYISGLVSTNPTGSDPRSQGDDHLRLIKSALLSTFPNITGAVTATHAELNYLSGATSNIQAQISAISANNRISTLADANSNSTLSNAAYQLSWNWALTGAADKGLSIAESAKSVSGVGAQDLVSIATLANSTANPLRVQARGADALLVGYDGAVSITSASAKAIGLTAGIGGAINITTSDTSNGTGSVNITAGSASLGAGGSINLAPGTGANSSFDGRVNFINSNTANGTKACSFTASVGPSAANTSIQGWLTIKVSGTVRYIPYW